MVNQNPFRPSLRVMATAQILHLRENFDHGREGEDGNLARVEGDETLREVGLLVAYVRISGAVRGGLEGGWVGEDGGFLGGRVL